MSESVIKLSYIFLHFIGQIQSHTPFKDKKNQNVDENSLPTDRSVKDEKKNHSEPGEKKENKIANF